MVLRIDLITWYNINVSYNTMYVTLTEYVEKNLCEPHLFTYSHIQIP